MKKIMNHMRRKRKEGERKEMEETIVCNRWKDLAGDLLVVTSGLEMIVMTRNGREISAPSKGKKRRILNAMRIEE
jgi:hypothetical protein